MWPREHGAYSQLAFPTLTALMVAGINGPAVLVAGAAVAAFLAHEPLLVRLGRRGARARRENSRKAVGWLVAAGAFSLTAGLAALWLAAPEARWTFALPLIPAALYATALAMHAEKSTAGELAAAFAFSLIAIPMCVAAGLPRASALAIGMSFAALSGANTLGVRVVILRVRAGGDPRAVRTTRLVLTCWIVAMVAALGMLVRSAALSSLALAAIGPGLVISLTLAFRPPPATRLRVAGWALVSASITAMILLAVGFRVR
jgi:hypothetical protein